MPGFFQIRAFLLYLIAKSMSMSKSPRVGLGGAPLANGGED